MRNLFDQKKEDYIRLIRKISTMQIAPFKEDEEVLEAMLTSSFFVKLFYLQITTYIVLLFSSGCRSGEKISPRMVFFGLGSRSRVSSDLTSRNFLKKI